MVVTPLILAAAAWFGEPEPSVTLAFGGDVMLGRLVNATVREQGPRHIWGDALQVVREADATLIITWNGLLEPGTVLTLSECRETGRTSLHVDMEIHPGHPEKQADQMYYACQVREWLEKHQPATLNIAGNRESNSPGIQEFTLRFLELIFYGGQSAGG